MSETLRVNRRRNLRRQGLVLCACLALSACRGSDAPSLPPTAPAKCAAYSGPPLDALHHYEGTLHEHGADGKSVAYLAPVWVGARP